MPRRVVCRIVLVLLAGVLGAFGASRMAAGYRGAAAEEKAASRELVYVSDYFSFVGEDEKGHVAFALDTNRGRDGQSFQAEHFTVLHDERRGWVKVEGSGAYDNKRREVETIPDSPFFRFQGRPGDGITITSGVNRLSLRVDPIPERLSRREGAARYWMGSAAATLTWAGRTLTGRVIYEFLFKPDFNRLTRTYPGMWKEFHGFYVRTEGEGDLYLHSQQSPMLAPLVGNLAGFAVLDGETRVLDGLAVEAVERERAWGFYRWPMRWRGSWGDGENRASFAAVLSDRKVIRNWIVGGFAMGVLSGELVVGGRKRSFYGLGELLI